jgi:hypothetical protein
MNWERKSQKRADMKSPKFNISGYLDFYIFFAVAHPGLS